MRANQRIVILGGGIAGLSTAWHLAVRGAQNVLLVEGETQLGRHATAQNAAILRSAMPDATLEELALESARFLREPPPGFAAAPLLDACGLVIAADEDGPESIAWNERFARRPRADLRELSQSELEQRAPHFVTHGLRSWLLASEGRVDVERLLGAFESGARRLGVQIELGARVRRLLPEARGLVLESGRTIVADCVVLAAGAWAHLLAGEIGSRVELFPTRRHLLVTRPDARVDARWPVVWTDGDPFYARPEAGGLLISGCDEEPLAPNALTASGHELARAWSKAGARLRGLEGLQAQRFWAGIRTHGESERFVIGRDPELQRLVWVAGLGGHGITCGPIAGRLAAECVLDGASRHPLARTLDPARYAPRALHGAR
jgi:D-arginine dehydrogenase